MSLINLQMPFQSHPVIIPIGHSHKKSIIFYCLFAAITILAEIQMNKTNHLYGTFRANYINDDQHQLICYGV